MVWKLGRIWVGALIGSGAAATQGDTVRVFVYDYAQVSPATLEAAKGVASDIFKRAGLELEWADCPVKISETPQVPPCSHLTPLDVQMRVLNAVMAKKVGTNSVCLGYAVSTGGFGAVAAVYYERAVSLEQAGFASLRDILGAAMAHEIGHLLLAKPGHSSAGLMRPGWDKADLTTLARGRLLFSESQARRMAEMAAKRLEERVRRAPSPSGYDTPVR